VLPTQRALPREDSRIAHACSKDRAERGEHRLVFVREDAPGGTLNFVDALTDTRNSTVRDDGHAKHLPSTLSSLPVHR